MFQRWVLFLVTVLYLSLLFGVAYWAEKRQRGGRSLVANPYVYALSLAVYCTSWTFYGSVGKAANAGLSFLPIYIGPTLMALLWWVVLRKIIIIAREHRITTIADFIGFRYGNSILLSGLVTVVASIGITPYLGLQIKAIISTFTILAGESRGSFATGGVIILIIALFAVIFGVRRQDISEKHEGLVFAIAIESMVKLAAFLMVGIFVTFFVFDGYFDVFKQISLSEYSNLLLLGEGSPVSYMEWGSLIFLSMMAIMFLPRQFHMAVVENHDVNHVSKAIWLFPLYLLLINIFVLPVAFGGLLLNGSAAGADTFVLTIPLDQGREHLALFVFLGGFSAASGMIIVESLAISNMIMNNLVNPAIYRFNRMRGFTIIFSNIKRLVILGAVFTGYLFAITVGEYFSLVNMGLVSFVAVAIFAPSILFGLYWSRGNRNGAIAGVSAGFAVWCYTLLLPAMVKAGLLPQGGLMGRLMESRLLNPHALFGIHGLEEWSHALFWGLLLNIGLYVGVSIFTSQSEKEERQALLFVESYSPEMPHPRSSAGEIEDILAQFIGRSDSRDVVERFLFRKQIPREAATARELLLLQGEAKRILSGILGTSIATLVFEDRITHSDQDRVELISTIKEMNKTLRLSRKELAGANRQLAMLKEFSDSIIESLPLGVATLDQEHVIRYWNKGMEEIVGVSKNRALASDAYDIFHATKPCLFSPDLKEGNLTCAADSKMLEGYVSRLTGASPGFVIVFQDVTEKRRIEDELFQATKHATIGRLAAGVSHEIGNPLASISSLVQEMIAEGDHSFSEESLPTINHHIQRIARIVRSLGDFARLYSRQRVSTRLADTMESTLELVRYDKNFRKINVHTEIGALRELKVDPDQIQQVFLNLILNARDAMPEGGDLDISMKETGGFAEIVFADSGHGIEEEGRDKIFDPFFTTKGPSGGTGLGLSISYSIIKDHGGSVEVRNRENGGAQFTVRLPVDKREGADQG